ncbi:FRA10AC1 [Cordylochernes scorpioides]|uniref:FRA10AC1 n=1 Tax=Cordylochernes scorpioides TaxID=51811 RepID=A0ABY6KBV3_9ARAC|nr:FRA10AC1 [Cordylochernes scorpioides]
MAKTNPPSCIKFNLYLFVSSNEEKFCGVSGLIITSHNLPNAFVIKTGSTTQWQADLAPKEMAASDMRNRRHGQLLLTWSTESSCIPGLGALTGYSQHGQLSPGFLVSLEKRLAKKYYDRLFKEYSICNLSLYKENKMMARAHNQGHHNMVALRWRVEQEVIEGKGQFICGNKQCQETEGLRSWEVNFGYMEHGEKKNALVKLRLCPPCSDKLNYRHRRKEIKLKKKRSRPSQEVSQETPQKKQRTENEEEEASSTEPEAPSQVWSKPIPQSDEDKPQEEEFEDYLADMFL